MGRMVSYDMRTCIGLKVQIVSDNKILKAINANATAPIMR